MSKHTPGPWGVVYKDKYGQLVVKDKHIEIATCWHHCVGEIEKEMHANARLIAAAPDLLQALKIISIWAKNGSTEKDFDDIARLADETIKHGGKLL